MPLYYFDVRVLDNLSSDDEGTELLSIDDVQDEAAYALTDLLRDQVRASNGNPLARHLTIEVRGGSGSLLHASFLFEMKRLQ